MNDTKTRLLDAAETLFAERGYAATSLRDITALAAANLASVNYHFGSKEALLEAVFDRRIQPVNAERLELLELYERQAGEAPPSLEKILWAFLAPPFRHMHEAGQTGRRFLQLVGRIHTQPGRVSELLLQRFTTVKQRFQQAFSRVLPELGQDELARRMHYTIGAMAHTFCWCEEILLLRPVGDPQQDAVLHSLIRFAAAGLRAPESPVRIPSPAVVGALGTST